MDMFLAEERIESALGSWTRHTWTPDRRHPLATIVRTIIHWDGSASLSRERLFPDASVELVVHLGEPHRLVTSRGLRPLPVTCISGIQSKPAVLEAPGGRACTMCIRLHPTGAYALLGQPVAAIHDLTVDLRDCIGRSAAALTEEVERASTPMERTRRAIAWLLRRVADAPGADPRVAWAAGAIECSAGAVSITALRTRVGIGASRFASTFREQVGVSPKRYARLARFRRALALLHQQDAPALTAVALTAGYSDQPHMNREFRELGGLTPREFRAAVRAPQWISTAEPGS
jgi:AraC-like DNA-binding protein